MLSARSVSCLQSLIGKENIKVATDLATSVLKRLSPWSTAVFQKDIRSVHRFCLTEGIPDVEEAVRKDDDPEPADVQADIDELDISREAISANIY